MKSLSKRFAWLPTFFCVLIGYSNCGEMQFETKSRNQENVIHLTYPDSKGKTHVSTLPYDVVDGDVVIDGDMVIGSASEVQPGDFVPFPLMGNDMLSYQNKEVNSAALLKSSARLWRYGVVPYVISDSFSATDKANLLGKIAKFNRVMAANQTGVQLVPRAKQIGYIWINYKPTDLIACGRSSVGRRGKAQALTIYGRECITDRVVHHEILHALGFIHEHQRWDRGEFISVKDNDNAVNYGIVGSSEGNTLNTPYDLSSIMHYRLESDSDLQLQPGVVDPGGRDNLSQMDIEGIKRAYKVASQYDGSFDSSGNSNWNWGVRWFRGTDITATGINFRWTAASHKGGEQVHYRLIVNGIPVRDGFSTGDLNRTLTLSPNTNYAVSVVPFILKHNGVSHYRSSGPKRQAFFKTRAK